MKDVIRLSNQTKNTLKTYSENPNHAVSLMSSMITALERDIKGQNRIIEELQKALHNVTGVTKSNVPLPKIVPASQLRTIGKIGEDEKLEEPVGRQGRDIR